MPSLSICGASKVPGLLILSCCVTVQPDLMLQRERREAGGPVERRVRAVFCQASGFDLVHPSSLGAGQLRLLSLLVSPHAAEGCAPLGVSQLDVLLTGEGHIMVDTKTFSSVKDVSQVCTHGSSQGTEQSW
jgi:hypothetical protein